MTYIDKVGYWEPHSSSIDFCESNYLHFYHIAEFHNVWSSLLGLSLFGLIGLFHPYNNPTQEWRYTLAYATLFIIGLGSAALHGTLNWVYQSSDELPMIYLTHCLLYMCLEIDAPRGQSNYPYLSHFFIILTLVLTVLYYTYQQVYLVFIFVFTLESILILYAFYRILVLNSHPSVYGKQWAYRGVISYVLVAFPLWLVDMLQCHHLLSIVNQSKGLFSTLLRGATPHVIWHFGSGYGAYCFILSLVCVRMEKLNIPYGIRFQPRILPFVPAIVPKRNNDKEC